MRFMNLFLLAVSLGVIDASDDKPSMTSLPTSSTHPLSSTAAVTATSTNTLPTSVTSTTTTSTTATTLTTTTTSSTSCPPSPLPIKFPSKRCAFEKVIDCELKEEYKKEAEAVKRAIELEKRTTSLLFCNANGCPSQVLEELVANHSIIITDPKKLGEVFSKVVKISPEEGSFIDNLRKEFKAPERLLSLDFAAIPDLKLDNAITYAQFLKPLMEQGDKPVSLPAVYMLNAFLQLDSMLHQLVLNGHTKEDLKQLFEARSDLLNISRKKAHYETVLRLASVPFSQTVRTAAGLPKDTMNVLRTLETVDAIVSQGAIPELRAYLFAKSMSALLLTEDAVELEFTTDAIISREPYVTFGFPLWFADVLSFVQHSLMPPRLHSILKSVITSGNIKCIHKVADYFPTNEWIAVLNQLSSEEKLSVSASISGKPYLLLCLLKAIFEPLLSEISTEQSPSVKEPLMSSSSLDPCLRLSPEEQPQCVYEVIVKTFAAFESSKNADDFRELANFFQETYQMEMSESKTTITQELHKKVHNMIVAKIGKFTEMVLYALKNINLKIFKDFVEKKSFDLIFFENLVVGKDESGRDILKNSKNSRSDAKIFKSSMQDEKTLREHISKLNFMLYERENLVNEISVKEGCKQWNPTMALKSQVVQRVNWMELFNRFYAYNTIVSNHNPEMLVQQFERYHGRSSKCVNASHALTSDTILLYLCENPVFISSTTYLAVFDRLVDAMLPSPFKAMAVSFLWDYFATRGIDISYMMNRLQLDEGHAIYDVSKFPFFSIEDVLKCPMKESGLRDFCLTTLVYMALMPYMRVVNHFQSIPSEILQHFSHIVDKMMMKSSSKLYYRHAVLVCLARLANTCVNMDKIDTLKLLVNKHWNNSLLIESLGLLPPISIARIGEDKKAGPLAFSALISRNGNAFLLENTNDLISSLQFVVSLLEKDEELSENDFIAGCTKHFYVFLRDAVDHGNEKIVMGDMKTYNRVYARLQFIFDPSYEHEETELKAHGLDKCASNRQTFRSMAKAMFDPFIPQAHRLLIKVLYNHYERNKMKDFARESTAKHSFGGRRTAPLGSENTIESKDRQTLLALLALYNSTKAQTVVRKPRVNVPQKALTPLKNKTKSLSPTPKPAGTSVTPSVGAEAPSSIDVKEVLKIASSEKTFEQSPSNNVEKPKLLNKKAESKPEVSHTSLMQITQQNQTVAPLSKKTAQKRNLDESRFGREDTTEFLAPTPKKVIKKITELKDDVASYFKSSTNGIRAPSPSLRPGTHELLLTYANAKGFPFLLDENFYNFLVGEEYKVDMSSFGNQLDAWIEAKQNVPLKHQVSRLQLWVPNDSKSLTFSKNYSLHIELETFLNENVHLRNRLVSLLQNSIQGKKSFDRITVLSKSLSSQKIEIQSGTLSFDPSVSSAQILCQLLSDFLSLKMQPVNEEKSEIETISSSSEEALEEADVSQAFISTATDSTEVQESLIEDCFMAYEGQLQEITSDIETQSKRIRVLRTKAQELKTSSDNDYKQRLQNMRAGNAEKRFVEKKIRDLVALIDAADYIAVDFELTGVAYGVDEDPNGFADCLKSIKENSIVQVGLMLMKKNESGKLVQESSGRSIWKIPVCMSSDPDDTMWRQNSLDFLRAGGFDFVAWKVQCLTYAQLDGVWKALLRRPLITHNGLLDVLHLLKAAGRARNIENLQTTDDFKKYLNAAEIRVYDTRVLYNPTHMNFPLTDLSKAILPSEKLTGGALHDASFDAYLTGHLCRSSERFLTVFRTEGKNVLLETKRRGEAKAPLKATSSTLNTSATDFVPGRLQVQTASSELLYTSLPQLSFPQYPVPMTYLPQAFYAGPQNYFQHYAQVPEYYNAYTFDQVGNYIVSYPQSVAPSSPSNNQKNSYSSNGTTFYS